MPKDEAWFKAINWDEVCINECHKANNGTCPWKGCAEMHYDDNGNLIPFDSITFDGDYQEANANE
jgi:hypothetical protein